MDIRNMTLQELWDAGCAVLVYTPEELGDAPVRYVEDAMSEAAAFTIEFWEGK